MIRLWNWPWTRVESHTVTAAGGSSEHADKAEKALQKAQADGPRVDDLVSKITRKMEENQWTPRIAAAMRAEPRHK